MLDLTRLEHWAPTRRQGLLSVAGAITLMAWPLSDAHAQFRVEVSGVGLTQFPFSIVNFRGNDAASQNIAAIVRADLERSGAFKIIDAGVINDVNNIDYGAWKAKGADALVVGVEFPDACPGLAVRLFFPDVEVGGAEAGDRSSRDHDRPSRPRPVVA